MRGPEDIQEVETKEEQKESTTIDAPPKFAMEEMEKVAAARALGLENFHDIKSYGRQIEKIVQWAKAMGAESRLDIVAEINGLRSRLGQKTIYDLSTYVQLDMERIEVENKLKKFYGQDRQLQ